MKRRDLLVSAGAVVLAAGVIRGSSGFSNTNGEREVSANVVKDSDAYLGLEFPSSVDVNKNNTAEITIRNQATAAFENLVVTFNSDIPESVTGDKFEIDGKKVKLDSTSQFNTTDEAIMTVNFSGSKKSEIRFSITAESSRKDLTIDIEQRIINLENNK